jgi:hypothetical protein
LLEIYFSERQKLFSWLSVTTLPVTALFVFFREPDLPDLTVSAQILSMTTSLLFKGKRVRRQRQKLFSWLSMTTLSDTVKYVFPIKPDLPELTVSAEILL